MTIAQTRQTAQSFEGRKIEPPILSVRSLEKAYIGLDGKSNATLCGISVDIRRGEFFTLLGPSGCGKTTTLQCVAGLETPDSGEIILEGQTVFSGSAKTFVPANRRDLGMVFQSYAIWPHMTVFENVAFPLQMRRRGLSQADIKRKVMATLERVELAALADRPSPYLSGGQQQRVALARALVHEPKLLLLDEPLSNLDARLRDIMRVEIRQLVKSLGITTIYVTHDQLEALSMSDRIALMQNGRMVQVGTARELFLTPATVFAGKFMGYSNLIPATVLHRPAADRIAEVETDFGSIKCHSAADHSEGQAVMLLLRPHSARVHAGEPTTGNILEGVIEQATFSGDVVDAVIRVGNSQLRVALDPFHLVEVGQRLSVVIPADRCVIVPAEASPSSPHSRPGHIQ